MWETIFACQAQVDTLQASSSTCEQLACDPGGGLLWVQAEAWGQA